VQIPQQLLSSLDGLKDYDEKSFLDVHSSGQHVTSLRVNPSKPADVLFGNVEPAPVQTSVPWSRYGRYLDTRPSFTFDPLFHAGCYYVQEASSMFLEQALTQTTDLSKPLRVLDVSAAPGGKSTHLQSLISSDSLLVSNDVIRARANILKDNMIRWGGSNVMVTFNDPGDFSRLESFFDVIVIDAPCSGSGLFRREPDAINEWSEASVRLCSLRQQRILADVYPALKQDGILIYSTCSYSTEEDEDVVDQLTADYDLQSLPIACDPGWGITEVITPRGAHAYRFWPYKLKGEGFFIAAFKKISGAGEPFRKTRKKAATLTAAETARVLAWCQQRDVAFVRHEQTVYAWREEMAYDMNFLLQNLRVIYSGVLVGELKHDKLVPDHALAMSSLAGNNIPRVDLDHASAIRYLQRKDLVISGTATGWHLVCYKGQELGWANILPNRINNYYPKEVRIMKDKE